MWAICPRPASSGYHAEFHECFYQKHTNPLNCRTSSSDISGYHADFHEGHGTIGEWQGRRMVNGMLVAWALHHMCVLAFTELQKDPQCYSLNIHPLINGFFRRIILYSYSKLGANFSGRSPVSWLCYVELAQLFLQPHSYLTQCMLNLTYKNSFFGLNAYLKQKYVKSNNGNRGVTHSPTQDCCTRKYGDKFYILHLLISCWGTRWRSWLRHGATSRKVAGSIPDGVTGFFH
jgi:hypothetical protein